MLSADELIVIQEQLGALMIQAAEVDLDGFLDVAEKAASPQALAHGLDPRLVTGASAWAEVARALKPFHDLAVARTTAVKAGPAAAGDLVPDGSACPQCGERRIDLLTIRGDESVDCGTCGKHYDLPRAGSEENDAD